MPAFEPPPPTPPLGTSGAMDFFGPSFQVVIVPAGTALGDVDITDPIVAGGPLEDVGPVGSLARRITSYVTSISVTLQGAGATSAEVVFSPPYDVALQIFNETTVLNHGNIMIVKMGYPETNDVTGSWIFRCANPAVSMGIPTTNITVAGTPMSSDMGRTVSNYTWRFENFGADYALGVIKEIAASYGMEVVPGNTSEGLNDQTRNKFPSKLTDARLWRESIDQIDDDFTFVKRLCHNSGCDFRIDGNKIVILDHQSAMITEAVCLFRFYGQVDSANNIFPMESFDVSASTLFVGETINSTQLGTVDQDKQETQPQDIDPQTSTDIHGATGPARPSHVSNATKNANKAVDVEPSSGGGTSAVSGFVNSAMRAMSSLTKRVIPYPKQSEERRARGKYWPKVWGDPYPGSAIAESARASTKLINATLVTPGNPHIYPFQNVFVEGVGRFSGVYRVQKIIHRYDGGTYKTTLELVSNSYGSDLFKTTRFFQVLSGASANLADTEYRGEVHNGKVKQSNRGTVEMNPEVL